ncbi:MAG: chromosome condensation regulator RCC1 [Rhodobacter sp.]|nr:hypothetical protein [Paracoccaceae bacterium]MCC0076837.1 chromosome condensation regulator RCC1 [Rhodobacter sp.]
MQIQKSIFSFLPLLVALANSAAEAQETEATTRLVAEPFVEPLAAEGGVRAVAAGAEHTCAISQSGNVWCWGFNWQGQLGDGTDIDRVRPRRVVDLEGDFVAITAGVEHSCALTAAGAVYCWGDNDAGQLGDGTTRDRWRPVQVVGMDGGVQAIVAGNYHTCAIADEGRVFCWGANHDGQIGVESIFLQLVPRRVRGLGRFNQAIAAGASHSCAIDRFGRILCWGDNYFGQLGDGTNEDRRSATVVSAMGTRNRAISASGHFTCAINRREALFCWGANRSNQLLNGTGIGSNVPVNANLQRGVQAVTTGGNRFESYNAKGYVCVLDRNRALFCWGLNNMGQLGIGNDDDTTEPTRVDALGRDVRMVVGTMGGWHTCAVGRSGRLLCWGLNWHGQLGDGTEELSTVPVRVLGGLHRR